MKHTKIWGTTETLIETPLFSLHRIEVKKGGYCSIHHHKFKYNYFYVISGNLEISVWKEGTIDNTNLVSGESTSIFPNEKHRFTAIENTIAFEIYYTSLLDSEDIIRINQGGVLK